MKKEKLKILLVQFLQKVLNLKDIINKYKHFISIENKI